mmetsp:Transcript_16933/g.33555  ORF Transcript_16933/g.33555 Transcript_16933/m.33555 type:complete len:447 (+) Transcript_16933:47-1387(+)
MLSHASSWTRFCYIFLSGLATFLFRCETNGLELSGGQLDTWLAPAAAALSRGQVVVVKNFIDDKHVKELRADAQALLSQGAFKASGLTNTAVAGTKGQGFSAVSDRSICALDFADSLSTGFPNSRALGGNIPTRKQLFKRMSALQQGLATKLGRPSMRDSSLGHEAGYSVYQPGASLKRHLDEHHEELKGSKGAWTFPSRRSVSWLVYLNPPSWSAKDGGALRVFTVPDTEGNSHRTATDEGAAETATGLVSVGAHDMNLQVGWFKQAGQQRASPSVEPAFLRPVFMDCWLREDKEVDGAFVPMSRLYVVNERSEEGRQAVSIAFDYSGVGMPRGQALADVMLPEFKDSFVPIEDQDRWARGEDPAATSRLDVTPNGGTLVLFDSVTCPHEVLGVTTLSEKIGTASAAGAGAPEGSLESSGMDGSRVALAGWFHEVQQPFPDWLLG